MKQKLNLAVLNKRKDEMTEKEMNAVRAGVVDCQCEQECYNDRAVRFDSLNYNYSTDNCPCESFWVIFGLMWG